MTRTPKQAAMELDMSVEDEPAGQKLMADCFKALSIALLGEFFMSSDLKGIIFQGMLNNLETMGYTKEQVDKVRRNTNKVIQAFMNKNDFSG